MTKTKFVAKKSLGQHFLRSEKALKQIVDSIDTRFDKKNWLFEIGPGEGVLTAKLLDAGYKVCVVEVDKRSIEILHEDFRNQISSGQMKVLNKDCLEVDYSAELGKW
jgi:16S rRNA (adenine1518-N6/adenine1519-N6)-dimethyltransferase